MEFLAGAVVSGDKDASYCHAAQKPSDTEAERSYLGEDVCSGGEQCHNRCSQLNTSLAGRPSTSSKEHADGTTRLQCACAQCVGERDYLLSVAQMLRFNVA